MSRFSRQSFPLHDDAFVCMYRYCSKASKMSMKYFTKSCKEKRSLLYMQNKMKKK